MLVHLVAHAIDGLRPFSDATRRWWIYQRLRMRWPLALAVCVMPDTST